jgi:hypothetical protein
MYSAAVCMMGVVFIPQKTRNLAGRVSFRLCWRRSEAWWAGSGLEVGSDGRFGVSLLPFFTRDSL